MFKKSFHGKGRHGGNKVYHGSRSVGRHWSHYHSSRGGIRF